MDKCHWGGRCQDNANELAKVSKVYADQFHGRTIFAIPGHIKGDVSRKFVVRLPGECPPGCEGVVVAKIDAVCSFYIAILFQRRQG